MRLITTILFLALTLAHVSCSSDDKPSGDNNSFVVNIDGVEFKAGFVNGLIVLQNNLTISGSDAIGNNVVLNFPLSAATGDTYSSGNGFIASFDHANGDAALSSQGRVTITAHNTEKRTISGTFNFVGSPLETGGTTYVFTNGTFETSYRQVN